MMNLLEGAFFLLIFPGATFLLTFGLFCEWVDRKVNARLQNRVGPPLFQPFADLIKLLGKEDIIPGNVDRVLFQYTPLVALAAVMTPILTIPLWGVRALFPLQGDLLLAVYLLSIPTLALFVIGWASVSLYPMVGGFRAATMLFGFEVPFILACLSGGVVAGSWSISDVTLYMARHPALMILLLPGFVIALFALEAKLERSPFDIPHAESEIVAGTLTEYSGKKLAVMRLVDDTGMVVGSSLIAAIFLGGFIFTPGHFVWSGMDVTPGINFILYLGKSLLIVFLLSVVRTLFARLRIDQMLEFSWKYLATGGILQLFLAVAYAGIFRG